MNQPIVVVGPKTPIAVGERVSTPAGELSVKPGISIRREWGVATLPVDVVVEGVQAEMSFHIDGADEDDVPKSLRVVFLGGAECWMVKRGEPIEEDGAKIAWVCSANIDVASALPGEISCSLSEFDPPQDRRLVGIIAPSVKNDALVSRLEAAVQALLVGWANQDVGYAARLYAGMMRLRQAELEEALEEARVALVIAERRRVNVARMAGMAARMPESHREWPPSEIEWPAEVAHVELRGFAGADGVDPENVDEIVATAPASIHVETMSDEHTWMGVYLADGRRIAVNFFLENGKLRVGAEIDDEGRD